MFSFEKLHDRLHIFHGDLKVAILSLQREDYINLLQEIDAFTINRLSKIKDRLINEGLINVSFDNLITTSDIHNSIKNNVYLGYKTYFSVLDINDLTVIKEKANRLRLQHYLNSN